MPSSGDDPFAPRPEGDPLDDDPFAPAVTPALGGSTRPIAPAPPPETAPTLAGPLADRDPFAPPDETAEYAVTGASSFDDVLRRARRQGFLAGCLAGGAAAAAFAFVIWALVGTSTVPTRVVRAELARPVEASAEPREVASVRPGGSVFASPTQDLPDAAPATRPAGPARTRQPSRREVARAPAAAVAEAGSKEEGGEGGAQEAPAIAGEPAPADASPEPPASLLAPAAADAGARTAEPRRPAAREVMAELRARGDAIDECVALTPGHEADARGRRFQLLVVIEPGGDVSDVRVQDADIEATPLGLCLVRLARELSFPSFEGEPVHVEVAVRYGRAE